jgi:FdhD protein
MGILTMSDERNAPVDTGKVLLSVNRFRHGQWERIDDQVTVETPLRVIWSNAEGTRSGKKSLWAWPHELETLCLGHVLLDVVGLEASGYDRAAVSPVVSGACSVVLGNGPLLAEGSREVTIPVGLRGPLPHHAEWGENSGGASTLVEMEQPPEPPARLDPAVLFEGMRDFIASVGNWDGTGCFHRAGVFDPVAGRLLVRAEDVGRHNCLDRLAGWSALNAVSLTDKVLLTSARVTASLCAKALRAGFRLLVSRSAVTTAAVRMAEDHGATLLGFARTDEARFTVFSDTQGRVRAD